MRRWLPPLFLLLLLLGAPPQGRAAPETPSAQRPAVPESPGRPNIPIPPSPPVAPSEVQALLEERAAAPPAAKLAPGLRALATRASEVVDRPTVAVAVVSAAPLDLAAFGRVHRFTWPAGEHVALLTVRGSDLLRLAAVPGVARVYDGRLDPARRPGRAPAAAAAAAKAGVGAPPRVDDPSAAAITRSSEVVDAATANARRVALRLAAERTGLTAWQVERTMAGRDGPAIGAAVSAPAPSGRDLDRRDSRSIGSRPSGDGVDVAAVSGDAAGAAGRRGAPDRLADPRAVDPTTDAAGRPAVADPAPSPDGWFDVGPGHAASEAWALGYQGQGVRVGVLDTGIDFGHHDLQGTWATLPEGHPDAGWPQAYDPAGTYQYVLDRELDPPADTSDRRLRRGASGLIETYQVADVVQMERAGQTISSACFAPLRTLLGTPVASGSAMCDYTVPASAGDRVRFGHHPDAWLSELAANEGEGVDTELYTPSAETWSPAAPRESSPWFASADTLPDGSVLVVGGLLADRPAARYDPTTDAWQPVASPSALRVRHASLTLDDGRVLAVGGLTLTEGTTASAEIYDPEADRWTAVDDMSTPRDFPRAVRLPDGRVLVTGGTDGQGVLASAEILDPADGTWSPAAPMAIGRMAHAAVALADGRVLVAGGLDDALDNARRDAEVYDPAADAWTAVDDLSAPRGWPTASALPDGKVLVAGGMSAAGLPQTTAELFDPTDGTWAPAPSMAEPRFAAQAVSLGAGRVLVTGGGAFSWRTEIYDHDAQAWSEVGGMAQGRVYHAAAPLPDGRVFVHGGFALPSGELAGVLLTASEDAGVYDTVYVDLDNDHDFTDEQPMTKQQPLGARDVDDPADGVADLSGGLLYYIADGKRPLPGSYLWGVEDTVPQAGSLVGLFVDSGSHGTLCASSVASQGRLGPPSEANLTYRDLPGDGQPEAVNPGLAPRARLVGVGNVYDAPIVFESAWRYAVLGNDAERPDDDIQIASNSYGWSDIDQDGWDPDSRLIDHYVRRFGPALSFLASTGNGGPGYGTLAPPSPVTGLGVGSSTQFGAASGNGPARHSITETRQITFGDVIPFSNRGPGADGRVGPDVAADGAYGWGAVPINALTSDTLEDGRGAGAESNATWGGTSRSSPAAAGALALAYEAFRTHHERWPTWQEARGVLMSGARYNGYDPFTTGAGVVDAAASARIAGGHHGVYATPAHWSVGGYRGVRYPGFAKVIHADQTDRAEITLRNPSDRPVEVSVRGATPTQVGSWSHTLRVVHDDESPYHATIPDYLVPLDEADVPAAAELMVVRVAVPWHKADVDGDNEVGLDNSFALGVLQHTDWDGDGQLWHDTNGNGAVNFEPTSPLRPDEAWQTAEIDRWEFEALNLHAAESNSFGVTVHHPRQRWADGLHVALWHNEANCDDPDDPTTCTGRNPAAGDITLELRVDFYAYHDWPWLTLSDDVLTVPAGGEATLEAALHAPADAAPGAYQGAIFADYVRDDDDTPVAGPGGWEPGDARLVVPVSANVAARYDWQGALTLGGPAAAGDGPYANNALRGGADRTWRPETGDWRFFFLDATAPSPGTFWLLRTAWDDPSDSGDIDTSVWGPAADPYSGGGDDDDPGVVDPDWYGPYTLERLTASTPAYVGGGTWRRQTSSGGPIDWLAGPARGGLTEVMLHHVLHSGDAPEQPFEVEVSAVRAVPAPLTLYGQACETLSITPQIDLDGFTLQAAGLRTPIAINQQPLAADSVYEHTVTVEGQAARFVVELSGEPGTDVDLAVYYDPEGDGRAPDDEPLATSASITEHEQIVLPAFQPAGDYVIVVEPFSVPEAGTHFDLTIDVIAGDDLSATGAPSALAAGETVRVEVCADPSVEGDGPLDGVVVFGPAGGEAAISVPVMWQRTRPVTTPLYLPLLRRDGGP